VESERRLVGLVIGALAPIVVALALVPLRDSLANATLALILMAVVVIAAIVGGRRAAACAAVTATLAFDFFLTVPYNSMRIESADDIETVIIFLAVGLLVGEVAARFRRTRRDRERAATAIERVHRVAARVAEGAPLEDLAATVVDEARAVLHLQECWLEVPSGHWPAPRLERAGTISETELRWGAKGFVLPEDGLQLPVLDAGHEIGRLILIGNPEVAVTFEERIIAVALADQLGAAVTIAGPDAVTRLAQYFRATE
jgi:K+-sensing histidine kinase KdpD